MDIIVTTPRSRMREASQEARDAIANIQSGGESWYFRLIGSARVREGDRVYYVEDGYVRGFATVSAVENSERGNVCSTTLRRFPPGRYACMDARSWCWIEPAPMKGFQGWRYAPAWLGEVPVVGDWLSPRPATDIMTLF